MKLSEAKELLISGMDYAAYKEKGTSLYDSDKNRLFGGEHYRSGRPVESPSPWGEANNFEEKMGELLKWALHFGSTVGNYDEAMNLLSDEDSCLGRVARRAKG